VQDLVPQFLLDAAELVYELLELLLLVLLAVLDAELVALLVPVDL
jgi:hypothetical protein